ncbi:MAG: winged helix-turn-helix domain-containing protein [Haloferacaceae archaeon]
MTEGGTPPDPAPDEAAEAILDAFGDRRARHVLAVVGREPRSAKAIAEELDLSLPTVYRRIEDLQDYDLVVDRTEIGDDGNHYRVFECNFESTVISLEGGEYEVRVFRRGKVPDRFARLWDDLSRGSR